MGKVRELMRLSEVWNGIGKVSFFAKEAANDVALKRVANINLIQKLLL